MIGAPSTSAPPAGGVASYDDARDELEDADGYPGEGIEEEDAGPDDGLDDQESDDEADDPPARWSTPRPRLRQKPPTQSPGAPVPRSQRALAATPSGSSSWLDVPRDGFTARQAQRADEMSNSTEGRRHTVRAAVDFSR